MADSAPIAGKPVYQAAGYTGLLGAYTSVDRSLAQGKLPSAVVQLDQLGAALYFSGDYKYPPGLHIHACMVKDHASPPGGYMVNYKIGKITSFAT